MAAGSPGLLTQSGSSPGIPTKSTNPILANTRHVLRCRACCSRLMGPTLADLVSRKVLALVSDLSVPLPNDEDITNGLKKSLRIFLTRLLFNANEENSPIKNLIKRPH